PCKAYHYDVKSWADHRRASSRYRKLFGRQITSFSSKEGSGSVCLYRSYGACGSKGLSESGCTASPTYWTFYVNLPFCRCYFPSRQYRKCRGDRTWSRKLDDRREGRCPLGENTGVFESDRQKPPWFSDMGGATKGQRTERAELPSYRGRGNTGVDGWRHPV